MTRERERERGETLLVVLHPPQFELLEHPHQCPFESVQATTACDPIYADKQLHAMLLMSSHSCRYKVAVTAPVLPIGIVATSDETYLNGVRIGGVNSITEFRIYSVALSQLQVGQNSVAVRVNSPGGASTPGGLYVMQCTLHPL